MNAEAEGDSTSVSAKTIIPCESQSVTLKSTYIPEVDMVPTPLATSNRRDARYNNTLKILLFLYASLMFLKLIETLNDSYTCFKVLTRPEIDPNDIISKVLRDQLAEVTSIELVQVVMTVINICIMIAAFASAKTLTVVSIESIIGLCFIQLLVRLITPRFWSAGSAVSSGALGTLDTWTLLTVSILIVCLLIFKDIRKNNRNIERWAYVLFKEFSGPIPLKVSVKRTSSPSDKV